MEAINQIDATIEQVKESKRGYSTKVAQVLMLKMLRAEVVLRNDEETDEELTVYARNEIEKQIKGIIFNNDRKEIL